MGSVRAGCLFASEKTKVNFIAHLGRHVVCMKCAEKNRFELAMRAWGDSFLRELCLTRKIVRDRCCRTQDFFVVDVDSPCLRSGI